MREKLGRKARVVFRGEVKGGRDGTTLMRWQEIS